MTEKGWTPVLSGDGKTYCSPLCGFGCSKAEHDAATAKAASMAEQLGQGWSPVVWENAGWHAKVEKGCAEVLFDDLGPSGDQSYSAWINAGGDCFIARAATPEDALGFAVQEARTKIVRTNADLADLLEGAHA